MLRVLVADARAAVQQELRQTLATAVERCRVVEAHHCEGLRVRLNHALWDVVVLDLLLPGMNGLGVFDELKREHPHVPFLLMGEAGDPDTTTCCLRAGAAGYLDRSRLSVELLTALRTVLAGGVHVSHDLVLWPNPFATHN